MVIKKYLYENFINFSYQKFHLKALSMSDVCRLFIEVEYLIRIPENSIYIHIYIYIDRERQRQRERESIQQEINFTTKRF